MTERKYILREILFTGGDGNVPAGGSTGQYLRKLSSTDFDSGWATLTVASLTGVTATTTEVNYLTGVTSNIQTQLDSKVGGTLTSGRIYVGNGSNVATAVDVTGDVLISNAGVTSIASGVIVNADINASAAIAHTKMAALTASRAMVTDGSGFASASAVTGTELGYLSGVTSSLQTQLNAKLGTTLNSGQLLVGNGSNVATAVTISGDITINNAGVAAISSGVIVNADINASAAIDLTKLAALTASRALVSTAGGVVSASSVTSTELGYVSGVTSAIQTQLDDLIATQPVNAIVKTPTGTEDGYAITWDNTAGEYTLLDPVAQGLPTGGAARQYLIKQSGTNFDATFDDPVVSDITDLTASADDINLLTGADAAGLTSTEVQYLIGVTSNIQSQITQKQDRSLPHNAIWVGNVSNVPTALSAGTNGYVLTISSGAPTWQPSVAGFSNPMTTEGDLIIGDTGGAAIRLGIGTSGQVLTSDGTTASWSTPVYVTDGDKGDITVSGSGATWTVDANINKAWTGTHSFVDGNFSILGSADATKIAKFEVDGLTTATTRTFTLPDASGTVALTSDLNDWLTGFLSNDVDISSVSGLTDLSFGSSGSFVNFEIISDNIILTSSVGVTINVGSDQPGDIYYRDAGGLFKNLPIGSEGAILRAGAALPAYSTFTIPNTISALSTFVSNSANVLTEITPTAGQSIRVNAGGTAWEAFTPGGGGIGGSTGSVDNALLKADGTGGSTLQASNIFENFDGSLVLGSASLSGDRFISAVNDTSDADLSLSAQGVINLSFSSQSTKFFGTTVGSNNVHAIAFGNNGSGPPVGGLITVNNDGTGTAGGASLWFVSGTNASGDNPGGDQYFKPGDGVGIGRHGNIALFSTNVADWQDMGFGVYWGNADSLPTDNPVNGVWGFATDVEGTSELYFRTESGAVVCVSGLLEPIEVSGTTLTLTEAHRGKFLYFTNAAGCTVTVPTTLKKGFSCILMQDAAGAVSTTGATVNGKTSTTAQYDTIGLVHYKDTDIYFGK